VVKSTTAIIDHFLLLDVIFNEQVTTRLIPETQCNSSSFLFPSQIKSIPGVEYSKNYSREILCNLHCKQAAPICRTLARNFSGRVGIKRYAARSEAVDGRKGLLILVSSKKGGLKRLGNDERCTEKNGGLFHGRYRH
jgi:hypothetical protein